MKNKIVLGLTGGWALLAAINEAGLLDVLPLDNEKLVAWIKYLVAVAVIYMNMKFYNRTVNPDPKPPGARTVNPDPKPPKKTVNPDPKPPK